MWEIVPLVRATFALGTAEFALPGEMQNPGLLGAQMVPPVQHPPPGQTGSVEAHGVEQPGFPLPSIIHLCQIPISG